MEKFLTLALLLLFITSGVSAATITDEDIEMDLDTKEVKISLNVVEHQSSNFTYLTTHSINNLDTRVKNGTVECSVDSSSIESQISCDLEGRTNFDIYFNYTTANMVRDQSSSRIFQFNKDFIRPTDNFSLSVILPQGNVLLEQDNITRPVFSPQDGQEITDGRRIGVRWSKQPQLGESTNFRILYRPIQNPSPDPLRYLPPVLLGILSITAIVLGYRRYNRTNLDEVYENLEEDEKKVVELLKDNEGSLLQKDLVDKMDYSKAKVSGIVSELVEKEILTKEKEGRSNRLSISKEFVY